MLTIDALKTMKPGEQFATGTGMYPRLHPNEKIKWVAVRGNGYHDWAIYYFFHTFDQDYIARQGDKIISKDLVKELVLCDDEALDIYRS